MTSRVKLYDELHFADLIKHGKGVYLHYTTGSKVPFHKPVSLRHPRAECIVHYAQLGTWAFFVSFARREDVAKELSAWIIPGIHCRFSIGVDDGTAVVYHNNAILHRVEK